jgi:SAM-dependent methyltransferase
MDTPTLSYYVRNAKEVAARYESVVNGLAPHFEQAFASGARVLDLGCGSGRDMAYLHKLGRHVYGLDATPQLVELAQEAHPELRGRVVHGVLPGAAIPFGGAFDGVLCSAVLMHIPLDQLGEAATFIKRCMRPGGHLLYSVPSKREDARTGDCRDAQGRLFVPDAAHRLLKHFERHDFTLVQRWSNEDSLGRDGVAWASVLMQLGTGAMHP